MVGGYRERRKDSFCKRQVSRLYNYLVTRLTGHTYKDINCGFKAFTKNVASFLELRGDMHRLMPALATSYGFRFTEIPISHHPRKHGQSKYRLLRHRGILDLIAFSALQATQARPFHVISEAGMLLLMLSFILFIVVYVLGTLWNGHMLVDLFRLALGFIAAVAGIAGAMCPAVGLTIESIAKTMQGGNWRASLTREVISAPDHDG
jgi:hypothetical protein